MSLYHNMPVVRNYITGRPVANHVRPINRSEYIRRIFMDIGNIDNNKVWQIMRRQGLDCSDSLINTQRKKVFTQTSQMRKR